MLCYAQAEPQANALEQAIIISLLFVSFSLGLYFLLIGRRRDPFQYEPGWNPRIQPAPLLLLLGIACYIGCSLWTATLIDLKDWELKLKAPLPEVVAYSAKLLQAINGPNLLLAVLLILLGVFYKRFHQEEKLAWQRILPTPHDLLIALVVSFMLVPLLLMIQAVLQKLFFGDQPQHHMLIQLAQANRAATDTEKWQLIFQIGLSTVVLAPLVEELLFRGLLQGLLRDKLQRPTAWLAIATTSFLFAIMHYSQGPAPIPLFFFSLVLGYLYERTGRIAVPILTHALLNLTTTVVLAYSILQPQPAVAPAPKVAPQARSLPSAEPPADHLFSSRF
jgi:membrane protease YdiL (CAAX protease family)